MSSPIAKSTSPGLLDTTFFAFYHSLANPVRYIYKVYSSTEPIKTALYVSRAEYTMVAKEKKNTTTLSLQPCFVSCYTHSSEDFNGKNIPKNI